MKLQRSILLSMSVQRRIRRAQDLRIIVCICVFLYHIYLFKYHLRGLEFTMGSRGTIKPVLSFGISSILGSHSSDEREETIGKQVTDSVIASDRTGFKGKSRSKKVETEDWLDADDGDNEGSIQLTNNHRAIAKPMALPLMPHLSTSAYLLKSLDRYRPKNLGKILHISVTSQKV